MFLKSFSLVLIQFFILPFSGATHVQPCDPAYKPSALDNRVYIAGCEIPPCILRRNTTSYIEMIFPVENEITQIMTSVYARIWSIPFPYLGIDGKSACNNIWSLPRDVKTACPLKRNQLYVYKHAFDIKGAYPKVMMTLHWALRDKRTNADIMCFEVPAKIT